MTAAELAELYLRQFAGTTSEGEPKALFLREEWTCGDPERAWPVFDDIVARRRDDEVLQQAGYRLLRATATPFANAPRSWCATRRDSRGSPATTSSSPSARRPRRS